MKAVLFILGLLVGATGMYFYMKGKDSPTEKQAEKGQLPRENILTASKFGQVLSDPITQGTARDYLKNYIDACLQNGEQQDDILKSLVLEKKAIDDIFKNGNCKNLRLYFGKKTAPVKGKAMVGDFTIIAVGMDSGDENITTSIWDECKPCPNTCPTKDF
jgi:hypothetical protein